MHINSTIRRARLSYMWRMALILILFTMSPNLFFGLQTDVFSASAEDGGLRPLYKGEDGSLVVQVFLDSFDKNDWENCEVTFVNVGTTKVEMEKDSFLEFLFPDGSSYKFVLSEFSLLPGERRLMKADAKYKGTINTENHLNWRCTVCSTIKSTKTKRKAIRVKQIARNKLYNNLYEGAV